jgi:2-aminoethylphosphonate-pyruvate transaminase
MEMKKITKLNNSVVQLSPVCSVETLCQPAAVRHDDTPRRIAGMSRDKLLFTPGPLTTSSTVKAAMMRDLGSRDREFIDVVRSIRERLLLIGGAKPGAEYECVLMQGSGTFAIESVISSVIPAKGKLLVLVNGAYGRRIAEMARVHAVDLDILETPENCKIAPRTVAERLNKANGVTHIAVIHCETTTGIVNPIEEIGAVVAQAGSTFIVDAMSSFGAIPIDLDSAHADFLISSANKCIEGVPGFAFVLARRDALVAAKGRARTLSLDLHAQWSGLERDGQFRFTPPTHTLLAFDQALRELEAEDGVAGRAARYRRNYEALSAGMEALGFEPYLSPEDQSYIISTYRYPAEHEFHFEEFYSHLSELGFVIYPGKLSQEACFRIGTVGRIDARDIQGLLEVIGTYMRAIRTRQGAC